MASAKLKLKTSQTLKDCSHPIIIQILKDKKKAITTLNINCHIEEWDIKTNLPKNRRLSLICQKKLLECEELLFEGIDKGWSAKKIASIFAGKDTKEIMFFKYSTEINFENKIGISTKLLDASKLKKFKNFIGGKDISFNELDFQLLSKYKKFLEDEGLKSATRYLSILRQVYNYAIEQDDFVPKKNPFKSSLFSKKITTTTINRNLNLIKTKELFKLNYGTGWGKSYKDMSLDFWKFCFLMRGINFIEMALIKPKDIEGEYFSFTREKLKTKISTKQKIKIYPEAREIIKKYFVKGNDYIFPLLENGYNKDTSINDYKAYKHKLTVINSNLRNIGKKDLNVDFNLTSMSARYTFINLAKLNEVPFLYLQELLGHKTKSTTDIYLDVFPQEKIDNYHRMVIDTVLNISNE
ncbi:phage integrase SAM-like domain-containing protein [Tenacibaculum ovolyticum]|uniref:phage integrase SAM-like domain-containing protein n=1 Tax=Tenacibaculum ovolyticum TaxID=104270 RepID=UPI0003FA8692|nr:phage integrase SAM-like domain-containing protein [Tenacibaculum ovolyticum]